MSEVTQSAGPRPGKPEWFQALARFEKPDHRFALRQLSNTVLPLLGLWALMLFALEQGCPYWIILLFSFLTAGLFDRSFIFLHDASHGCFFTSPRANAILGFIIGVATFTPYSQWRWTHLRHHGTFANLDRRGVGDIDLMTVEEYRAAPRRQQIIYRLYRHPLLMFGLGSTVLFGMIYRFPIRGVPSRERRSVWFTDAAMLAVMIAAYLTVGLRAFLLVMAPTWIIGWTFGVWLFYVQHQFEGVYWARQAQWDYIKASLLGASYYKLPKVLQWFTGNIGLHHLHHLRPHIPNYHLQQAYDETPAVQTVKPLTLRSSLKSLRLNLYDEHRRQLVGFRDLDKIHREE
jgi:acyl-lipid omega-6 desaturase (Delta-12 desaturase)